MRKTKIVCTLGPATDDARVMEQLIQAGMNVARLNMSHGDYDEHKARIRIFNEAREIHPSLALLLDTRGPEIRTGIMEGGGVTVREGDSFILTTREIVGNMAIASVSFPGLPDDVSPGNSILIDDGLVELRVQSVNGTEIACTVMNGGRIGTRKGINLPGVDPSLPAVTEKDIEDIRFGVAEGIDYVAASFTRKAQDIEEIRGVLRDCGGADVHIVAKIENHLGIANIDEIIAAADGIMVARGDLGVEIPLEEVPLVQKNIVDKCILAGKPVIIATQMLESMIEKPRPTRAEASDVANSILDGADAIMLSGETAVGKYPVEAVRTMARIAERAEQAAYRHYGDEFTRGLSLTGAVSDAACALARDTEARAIIIPTQSGSTAVQVSRFRPSCELVATTTKVRTLHQLALVWGVTALICPVFSNTDDLIDRSIRLVRQAGHLRGGDICVITAGIPVGFSGMTNLIKVHRV